MGVEIPLNFYITEINVSLDAAWRKLNVLPCSSQS